MKTHPPYPRRAPVRFLIPFTLLVILVSGCGRRQDGANPEPPTPLPGSLDGDGPAIRLLVGPADQSRPPEWVYIGPSDAPKASELAPASRGTANERSVDQLGRTVEVESGTTSETLQPDSDRLLHWIAGSCLRDFAGDPFHDPSFVHVSFGYPWQPVGDTQTTEDRWYIFRRDVLTSSCDELLLAKELLLCAADRLSQIGSTAGTLSWSASDDIEHGSSDIVITVPPQATTDRFIVRQRALEVLGHLARLYELLPTMVTLVPGGCLGLYQNLSLGEQGQQLSEDHILSESGFANLPSGGLDFRAAHMYSSEERALLGRLRLEVESKVNLAASRLVREILEQSVRDDFAGAEREATAAGDPGYAARRRWGYKGPNIPADYNSIGHALRVLFGRLEEPINYLADPADILPEDEWEPWSMLDPRCGGIPAEQLLDALPAGEDARWSDRAPRTQQQALAMSLLAASGIVVGETAFQTEGNQPALKGAVIDQLLKNADIEAPPWTTGTSTTDWAPRARAIVDSVATLSGADLSFALARNADVLDLLLNIDDAAGAINAATTDPAVARSTFGIDIRAPEDVAPALQALGGVVLPGGVPADDLPRNPMARVYYAARKSQCPFIPPLHQAPEVVSGLLPGRTIFQSPIGLGARLRSFALVMAEFMEAGSDQRRNADLAVAEADAWIGDLLIQSADDEVYEVGVNIKARSGVAQALGVPAASVVADFNSLVAVVEGPLRAAECVAGLRDATCRDDYLRFVWGGTWSHDAANTEFSMHRPESEEEPSEPIYVVRRGAVANPGRILAVLGEGRVSEYDSPLRNELSSMLFGLASPERRSRTCNGARWDLSTPSESCVERMPREQFIPLANEITTEGGLGEDSWKHYLSAARQAAQKADELGSEWVQNGLERDLRREGAQEELAELCGGFVDSDQITVSGGHIDPTPAEGGFNSCLADETYDVVFFTTPYDPAGLGEARLADPTFKADVWDAYCVDSAEIERPSFCATKAGAAELELATLALAPAVPTQEASTCEAEIANSAAARDGTLSGNTLLDSARLATPGAINAALQKYQFVTFAEALGDGIAPGTWQLRSDGEVVLQGTADDRAPCSSLEDSATCETMISIFGDNPGLLRRVQNTLWHMGAIAGEIPQGTFSIPVPVADMSQLPEAEAAAIYGDSQFMDEGGRPVLVTGTGHVNTLDDKHVLAPKLLPMTTAIANTFPSYTGWRSNLSFDVFASQGAGYFALPTANAAIPFDTTVTSPSGAVGNRGTAVGEWIASVLAAEAGSESAFSEEDLNRARWSLSAYGELAELPVESVDPSFQYLAFSPRRDVCLHNGMPVLTDVPAVPGGRFLVHDFLKRCQGDDCSAFGALSLEEWFGEAEYAGSTARFLFAQFGATVSHGDFLPCWRGSAPEGPESTLKYECLQTNHVSKGGGWWDIQVQAAGERLRPTSCGPKSRVELFVHSGFTAGETLSEVIARVLALECLDRGQPGGMDPSAPPPIESMRDLRRLEAWLGGVETTGVELMGNFALTNVPKRTVGDFRMRAVGSGTAGEGEHGQLLLQLGQDLERMHLAWKEFVNGVGQVRSAVASTRVKLESVNAQNQINLLNCERERLELDRQITMSTVQQMFGAAKAVAASIPGGGSVADPKGVALAIADGVAEVAMGQINGDYARDALENVTLVCGLVTDTGVSAENSVMLDLNDDASGGYDAIFSAQSEFRIGFSEAMQTQIGLEQNRTRARWQAAKVAGADFVRTDDGEAVAMPVNTVLNRQYSILRQRYDRALGSARRAAYVARLAIEQRLGVRLNDLQTYVGPLPPPSTWADDLCTMQGVDYDALRGATPAGSGTAADEVDLVEGFADQYIGDYVDRLAEFVEFYNIQYPFHETDDTAILSLKDDLLHPERDCLGESKNLLYWSGALDHTGYPDDTGSSLEGWRVRSCSGEVCAEVLSGEAIAPDSGGVLPPESRGSVSWLRTLGPVSPSVVLPVDSTPEAEIVDPAPAGAVYQSLELQGGQNYVASWWAMGRGGDGAALGAGAPEVAYEVALYDDAWNLIAFEASMAGRDWGSRQSVVVSTPAAGVYHLAFFASPSGTIGGSLAVANVQLERASDFSTGPTAYEDTEGSRWVTHGDCRLSPSWRIRDAFARRCDGAENGGAVAPACWWELAAPIVLDVELAQAGYGPLVGNMAVGNYNERHLSTALNVLGTGVIDCSVDASQDCYGESFVEYDLVHAAADVPILGHDPNDVRCFDFAVGAIRGGKALAAERYITLPMSSADRELLGQSAFTKLELAGRPLSGTYRLRIKDSPRLAWDRVEDIQLVLNYRAWSRVSTPDGI